MNSLKKKELRSEQKVMTLSPAYSLSYKGRDGEASHVKVGEQHQEGVVQHPQPYTNVDPLLWAYSLVECAVSDIGGKAEQCYMQIPK